MMDPFFGVGIKKYLFEQNTRHTHDKIRTDALKQVKKYLPFVEIQSIDIDSGDDSDNSLFITIKYIISPLNQTDILKLQI